MTRRTTAEIIDRYNHAFVNHDPTALDELIGSDCVMEAIQPAPDGARTEGREACLTFWKALAEDRSTQFEVEDVAVSGERATIRWRYRYGDAPADSVRGVNLMQPGLDEGRLHPVLLDEGALHTKRENPLRRRRPPGRRRGPRSGRRSGTA